MPRGVELRISPQGNTLVGIATRNTLVGSARTHERYCSRSCGGGDAASSSPSRVRCLNPAKTSPLRRFSAPVGGLARSDAAGDNLRLCGRLCARPLQRHRPLPLLVDARGPGQGGRLWRLQAAHSAAAWHRVLSRPPERVQREQRQAVAELPGRKVAPLRAPAAVGAASGVGKVGPVLCARRAEVHTHGAHTLTATAPLTLEYRTT